MLEQVKRVHLLGVGGIGVSAVARILVDRGFEVSGSDVRQSQLTDMIEARGATVFIGHQPEQVEGADMVVVSTAIPKDNIELVAAQERGIPVVHRAEVLAALMRGRSTIGVTGTHGKGTVSSMIAWILDQAGLEPGFIIGALLNNYGFNARDGERLFVAEVDESDGSHLKTRPNRVVCNFLELDHLNYYKDLNNIIEAMARFIEDNPNLEALYINGDCAGNRTLIERLSRPVTTYGMETDVDVRGELLGQGQMPTRFAVSRHGERLGEAELNLPGRYNIVNACGAIAVAMDLGVPFETAATALARFEGLENRFTIVEAGGVYLVKDYISHPTGMRKVLQSARDLVEGRLISVFKPYRYTLMKYLADEYATAFDGSDQVVITTMYAAGEPPIEGVNTEAFVANLRSGGYDVVHLPDQRDIHGWVLENAKPGDKVLFFGGDDFFRMCDRIAEDLRSRNTGA
ncbi:MAG: UDP-N-acetylmuramate--L-alanine ligase [Myxococcota bacterium]